MKKIKLNMNTVEKVILKVLSGKNALLITPNGSIELKLVKQDGLQGKSFDFVCIDEVVPKSKLLESKQ